MCCFSQPVLSVSKTRIFARRDGKRQFLVYSMNLQAASELAMILPLPVPAGSPEDALRFINLEHYSAFFSDMDRLFQLPMVRTQARFLAPAAAAGLRPQLEVHSVGKFEASFVPTLRDFERLDPRFQIPVATWDRLPQYRDWGFAVFKLKQIPSTHSTTVHPMAFNFPLRDQRELFFPTIHIHDGQVHPVVSFDHELFLQVDELPSGADLPGYIPGRVSPTPIEHFLRIAMERARLPVEKEMDLRRAAGTLDPQLPLFRYRAGGYLRNQDARFFLSK